VTTDVKTTVKINILAYNTSKMFYAHNMFMYIRHPALKFIF